MPNNEINNNQRDYLANVIFMYALTPVHMGSGKACLMWIYLFSVKNLHLSLFYGLAELKEFLEIIFLNILKLNILIKSKIEVV